MTATQAPTPGPLSGDWPVVTDKWVETYCDLTGRDPDGGSVTFLGDGPVSTSFRDAARREIEAMLCAAPKSAIRSLALSPAPVASGGQHSSANDFPPGEVTDEWAERFCEAVNWSPDGQECKAVEGQVRCVSFRDLAKGYILSAIATQPAITSATAPVAETAGEAVAWRYRYPNDTDWQITQDHDQAFRNTGEVEPLGVIPFGVPAQDDDKLRRAVEALEPFAALAAKFGCWSMVEVCAPDPDNPSPVIAPVPLSAFENAAAVVAALKSEGK